MCEKDEMKHRSFFRRCTNRAGIYKAFPCVHIVTATSFVREGNGRAVLIEPPIPGQALELQNLPATTTANSIVSRLRPRDEP